MQTDAIGFTMSTEELWFLASLYGPGVLYDIGDPWLGLAGEEREVRYQAAIDKLVEKNFVVQHAPHELEVDALLSKMMPTCLNPERVFVLDAQKNSLRRVLYAKGKMIVDVSSRYEGVYTLTCLLDEKRLFEFLYYDLCLHIVGDKASPAFTLDADLLQWSQQLARIRRPEKAAQCLQAAQLPAEFIGRLVGVVNVPLGYFSLYQVVPQQTGAELKVLVGKQDTWLVNIEAGEAGKVAQFRGADQVTIKQAVLQIFGIAR